ncbi:NAD(P)/FAD-dependent oxidoreductase [Chondromyces crocatus]|uniref:Tryptophan 2-halogenase n=2 Tax=Chondromyces crocatus TaxID=52 RepID=THAL_CHOCO|nr:NAD(P)/FAD-dependent oxidoreductase [Chondromyces crocatus]Q0VZ69.1 RecName: Full=Tryptophan 2-halogenase [Chondromyces crocatus]AKT40594.1 halogenase [Chondromyces crocatus]CAJ46693.1 tryptophan halogenase [Chondromyces crocatus]
MQLPSSTKILVVGGGPAGSTAATLLAREGFEVTLVEKAIFPRYHIGESLLISVQPIIDLLGAREAVEAHGFQRKKGVLWEWGGERWLFDWKKLRYDYTFHVKREEFDEILLRNAQKNGVKVFEGIDISRLEFDGERPVAAKWSKSSTGESGTIQFEFLLDASGRAGLMATQYLRSRMFMKAFQNVATWGYWKGATIPEVEVEGPITVGSIPYGWIWGIPLRDQTMSVGLVIHQELFKEKRATQSVEEIYHEGLKASPLFQDVVLKGATLEPQIRTETDYSYISRTLAGPGFFLVGDSGAFIDPLLSSGVHLAMHSALLAAASVKSIIAGEVDMASATEFYQRCYQGHFLRWALIVASFYEVNARKETYFWTAQQLAHEELGVFNMSQADMKDVFATMVSGVVDLGDAQNAGRLQKGAERVHQYLDDDGREEDVTALLQKSKQRIFEYLDRVKNRDSRAAMQRYKAGGTETFSMGLDADGAVGGLYVTTEPRLGLLRKVVEERAEAATEAPAPAAPPPAVAEV